MNSADPFFEALGRMVVALALCLPIEQALGQTAHLGTQPPKAYLDFALRREGDPQKGKVLFSNEQRLACSKCHTVDGTAAKAGPDLFAIGDKFGRREIIESVLWPSATIAVGYETTIVETSSDDEVLGIIKQATDNWLDLMGSDGQRLRIPTHDVRDRRTSAISLMPEGLQDGLTLEEFTDVVEYLVSLKQPESAGLLEHGMPRSIPILEKPVTLWPFVSEDLAFAHPVWFGPLNGQANVFLVVEHESGKIWRLEKRAGGDRKTLFADLGVFQKGTRGLLGIALHPEFPQDRRYFFSKHLVENGQFSTVIGEREAAFDLHSDSGRDSRLIFKWNEATGVHYGGGLTFGPDGYLYIGTGDSGPQEDPQGHAQNAGLPLGKMLRIDVDHASQTRPYSIPADNPFVDKPGFLPEVWAWGFREPWRFSFDPKTGDLWVGDVGQDRYEEVDLVRPGENYGWNVYEGFEPFSNRYRRQSQTYIPPVFAYPRKFGVSVTGGMVYRPENSSSFTGVYVFGDYESRRIFGLRQKNRMLQTIRQIGTAPQRIVSFGRDLQGSLYLVGYEGMIYRLEFEGAAFP
jgi:putative heme-binding domain-containing protein